MFEDIIAEYKSRKSNPNKKKGSKVGAVTFIGFILLLFVFSQSSTNIPVTSVGVKYNSFTGEVYKEPLSGGRRFHLPFVEDISTIKTEVRSADLDGMNITTKDGQALLVDIELQYNVLPENAYDTFLQFRSTPENEWIPTFVYQLVQRGVQNSASKYSVSEILGEKRGDFQVDVDETVRQSLESNHLTMKTTSIDSIRASSPEIEKSIADKARAKQEVETAKQQKLKQEVENEQKIEKEKANAEAKKIKAEAEAEANRKISESVTQDLINYREADARLKHGWYKYNNADLKITEEAE